MRTKKTKAQRMKELKARRKAGVSKGIDKNTRTRIKAAKIRRRIAKANAPKRRVRAKVSVSKPKGKSTASATIKLGQNQSKMRKKVNPLKILAKANQSKMKVKAKGPSKSVGYGNLKLGQNQSKKKFTLNGGNVQLGPGGKKLVKAVKKATNYIKKRKSTTEAKYKASKLKRGLKYNTPSSIGKKQKAKVAQGRSKNGLLRKRKRK